MYQEIILKQFVTSHYVPTTVSHDLPGNDYTCVSAHPAGIQR